MSFKCCFLSQCNFVTVSPPMSLSHCWLVLFARPCHFPIVDLSVSSPMSFSDCWLVCKLAHEIFPLLTCLFACPCHFPTGHLSVSSPMSPSHCWLVYFLAHFTFCYCLKIHVDFSFLDHVTLSLFSWPMPYSCCFLDHVAMQVCPCPLQFSFCS